MDWDRSNPTAPTKTQGLFLPSIRIGQLDQPIRKYHASVPSNWEPFLAKLTLLFKDEPTCYHLRIGRAGQPVLTNGESPPSRCGIAEKSLLIICVSSNDKRVYCIMPRSLKKRTFNFPQSRISLVPSVNDSACRVLQKYSPTVKSE